MKNFLTDIALGMNMFPIYDLSGNPVAFSGRIYNKIINETES